ncbi:MAG: hypothetical protein ACREQN_05795, partial [Candidatus Binataceae bacterium]
FQSATLGQFCIGGNTSAIHRLTVNKEDIVAKAFLDIVEKRVPHYGCLLNEDTIRTLVDEAAAQETRNAILKQDAHNLRRYLQSYGLQVREFPYGFEVDRSNTPEQDLARFMSGEAPTVPSKKRET